MRVHEDVEAILFRLAQDADGVLYPRLVVLARPRVLNGLPGEDIADGVVAPRAQAGEVRGGVVEGERAVHEGHIVAVKEVFGDVGGNVGRGREFGVGGAVDAVLSFPVSALSPVAFIVHMGPYKDDLAVLGVAEGASVYAQPDGRHFLRVSMVKENASSQQQQGSVTPPYIYAACMSRLGSRRKFLGGRRSTARHRDLPVRVDIPVTFGVNERRVKEDKFTTTSSAPNITRARPWPSTCCHSRNLLPFGPPRPPPVAH